MDKYEAIPVQEAREIGKAFNKQIVVIVAWEEDCGQIHVTTWGQAARHKQDAADLGVLLAKAAGGVPELAKTFEDFRQPQSASKNAARVEQVQNLIDHDAVESYIRDLPYGSEAPDDWKTIVAGNLRCFAERIRQAIKADPS